MNAGVINEFRSILGDKALIVEREQLQTYECDALTNFRLARL